MLTYGVQVGGDEEGVTRLWGQWAMCANSWGSIANATCIFEAQPRGGRALLLVTGGTAAFPWVFHSMHARCSGGVALMQVLSKASAFVLVKQVK